MSFQDYVKKTPMVSKREKEFKPEIDIKSKFKKEKIIENDVSKVKKLLESLSEKERQEVLEKYIPKTVKKKAVKKEDKIENKDNVVESTNHAMSILDGMDDVSSPPPNVVFTSTGKPVKVSEKVSHAMQLL